MTAAPDWQRWYRIEPQERYAPQIGVLVEMLNYARMTTLADVRGLNTEQLWATPPGFGNSIGALLTHMAAVERTYHLFSLEGRDLDPERDAALLGGLSMGREGTPPPTGQSLETLLGELRESRAVTLAALAERDDAWLASRLTVPGFDFPNQHWAWFHVMEDEVNHRGQIRLIRKLVAPAPQPDASA
ncbi:putative damage-inducible protein DinB [Deinococcus sp. HSC-46F16]|uniref:mycothiol transferase n=1 Tax=Deinococcus sp. HSC-46F16 TaxID=2910968 RepID=UPI00209F06E7|nr:DUF664 domain-containing protein [Deinococcus sp. HSC-46F16]MCP2013394.1 putative damage-inducible protein DinB [Deinococcus sp. HSC-46F16]